MLKDFVGIISELTGSGFEIIRTVSSANRTILLFLLLSVASHFYIGGKARGHVLIPEEHHRLFHPNLR